MQLLQQLTYLRQRSEEISIRKSDLEYTVKKSETHLISLEADRVTNALSEEWFTKAIDLIYQASTSELDEILNKIIGYVFFDKNYRIQTKFHNKYGKSADFVVFDNDYDPPMELNVKKGVGRGIRTAIAAIIHCHYLCSKTHRPVLILDEAWSSVSEEYVTRFLSFIDSLCKQRDLRILIITHDVRFREWVDRVYWISDGRLSCETACLDFDHNQVDLEVLECESL